jgi:hypothetical protein
MHDDELIVICPFIILPQHKSHPRHTHELHALFFQTESFVFQRGCINMSLLTLTLQIASVPLSIIIINLTAGSRHEKRP